MSENTLRQVADTVLQTNIPFDFDIRPVSKFHAFLQRIHLAPVKKKFILKPITMGSLIKISKLLRDINLDTFDVTAFLESNYVSISDNGDTVAKIIAIAIHGMPGEVPQSLVQSVLNNFSAKDMAGALAIIFNQMDVQSFLISIISIKGRMDLLEMSPKSQAEIIAPGMLSAVV